MEGYGWETARKEAIAWRVMEWTAVRLGLPDRYSLNSADFMKAVAQWCDEHQELVRINDPAGPGVDVLAYMYMEHLRRLGEGEWQLTPSSRPFAMKLRH